MVVRRSLFFLVLFSVIFLIYPGRTLLWLLRSEKTMGVFVYQYEGNALDQFRENLFEVYFKYGKDTVVFKEPGRLPLHKGDLMPVRFLPQHPEVAKTATFRSLWGSSVSYGGIFFAVLLAVFLHPEVVPRRARLKLTGKKPFIKLVY